MQLVEDLLTRTRAAFAGYQAAFFSPRFSSMPLAHVSTRW